jgi:glycerol-3-phosphate acyltransferase PlsY
VLGVLHPIVAAVVVALWLVVSRLTGKAAVASIAAVVVTPIGLALTCVPAWEFAATVGLCALLVVRHAGNVRRMLQRQEHTLSRPEARPGS